MNAKGLRLAAALGAIAALGGCVQVHAYQRERLAKPIMAMQDDPEEAVLEQHFFQAREGATGGYGTAGGGCGCN